MHRRRAVHAAGLGALGALVLAGCASQPPAAGEAWERARAQIDDAESVRMSFVSTDGSQSPRVITWDLSGPLEGTDGTTEASMLVGEDALSSMTLATDMICSFGSEESRPRGRNAQPCTRIRNGRAKARAGGHDASGRC